MTRLNQVLAYMLQAKILLDSDADYLRVGAQIGDQEALAKIENIGSLIPDNFVTATDDAYTYAIQPSDRAISIDATTGSRPTFAFSDSVIAAKFVAANYDTSKTLQTTFGSDAPSDDVGVLKADGSFQNTRISSGDTVKANDILNVIGYPAFADKVLNNDKLRNLPIVTTSKVDQTYDKNNHRLIQTDTPIVPGNDGAGAFDYQGQLIGMALYGLPYCPDQQCFASGTVRSSHELLSLLDKQNIKVPDMSQATIVWRRAVDNYFKGNYSDAQTGFADAGRQYGFNRWAQPLQKLAHSKLGTSADTSSANLWMRILIGVLVVMVILTILLAIVFFLQRRRLDVLRVGHYGAVPVAAPQQLQTLQPVQPYPLSQGQPASAPYGQPIQPPVQPQPPVQQTYVAPQPSPQQWSPPPAVPQPQQPLQPLQPGQPTPPQTLPEDPFYRQ